MPITERTAWMQERGAIVKQLRDLCDKVSAEKRDYSAEEQQLHDRLFDQQDELRKKIERDEKIEGLEKEIRSVAKPPEHREPEPGNGNETRKRPEQTEEYRAAFNSWLRTGVAQPILEERALQADVATEGGYLVAPEQLVREVIKFVDNEVFIRGLARKFEVTQAVSLGAPQLDADPDDPTWTSELSTGTEDSAMSLGKRNLFPHPLAKRIKISNRLLRTSVIDIEGFVMERLGYKFGIAQEKAFMTGSGPGQPQGVFVADENGIDTSRDVSTGNSTTAVGADNLFEVKYSLKPQYHKNATWVFHRTGIKDILKLKNGDGSYLWQPGLQQGQPDRLLNMPYVMSEYAPSTFATGQYVGILGDFSYYWIVDSLNMQVQRLTELYAETNQTGFIGRMETDGAPVLAEAFARVTLA